MRAWLVAPLVSLSLSLVACGGDDTNDAAVKPQRDKPEATVARWVAEGDCGLFTDRYVAEGHPSVAEGRRACQAEADETPVGPYRVQTADAEDGKGVVVLAIRDGTRLIFWLVPHGERGWRIDGYQERRPGPDVIPSGAVIDAFERRTGERLVRLREVSGVTYEVLGFREFREVDPDPEEISGRVLELMEKFGSFNIYVADSEKEAKRLLGDAESDSRGVYWQRRGAADSGAPRWGAEKRYRNVVLSWTAGERQLTDRRFDRLDAAVRAAAEA